MYLLVIVDSAAVNILTHTSVWTSVFSSLGIFLGVALLGHIVTLKLIREPPADFPQ